MDLVVVVQEEQVLCGILVLVIPVDDGGNYCDSGGDSDGGRVLAGRVGWCWGQHKSAVYTRY